MTKSVNPKAQARTQIEKQYGFPSTLRAVVLVAIHDESTRDFIRTAASWLQTGCVFEVNDLTILGADACILDDLTDFPLIPFVQNGGVPILSQKHPLALSFAEFDPMRFEGNAFLFRESNQYLIFEKLVRYLENIRYAGDKRTLLSNIAKTF